MFAFVSSEWPCYIIRSAIVPGFIYLTDKHICFYASLVHSQVKKNSKYNNAIKMSTSYQRCYFDLKNDVLAWYENAIDNYSPLGKIDLKYAQYVHRSKKRDYGFRINTMTKTWHFQADTEAAVIEWINVFQKAIFKAKNTGSSLKVVIPMENILDIEQPVPIEFQQFLKIRTVGIDDSLVMDEYYFAYFPDIKKTYDTLIQIWESFQVSTDGTNPSPQSQETSPSMSISDIFSDDVQPVLSHTGKHQLASYPSSSMSSAVVQALFVPGALAGLLKGKPQEKIPEPVHREDPVIEEMNDSSSSGEEDQAMVGWLGEKRRSGMKLVYGLLGGNTGSAATAIDNYYDDDDDDDEDEERKEETSRQGEPLDERTRANFRKYFVLPESEKLYAVYRCYLMKTLPCYGKLYISSNHLSFNSKGFATKAKIIIPFQDVLRIQKIHSRGYIFHALSILTQKKKEANWEASLLDIDQEETAGHMEPLEQGNVTALKLFNIFLSLTLVSFLFFSLAGLPILSHKAVTLVPHREPEKPLHITCITIGTRGDVQPYIALCKGLMKQGHTCRIATHDEFKDWIEEHGIEFRSIGGDPGELMRICVENSFFSVNFVREGLRLFKVWINELLELTWKACQGTEMIIESPSAMVGVHMAEKLRVPYFRAFPMPMTRTRSFPHPFATPNSPKGRLYNDMTYVLFDHAVWRAIAKRTNDFRQQVLSLPATSYEKLEVWKIPYLYCFSQSIVPSPLDWMDWIHCTGYWFLDNAQASNIYYILRIYDKLQAFLDAPDKRPIVYIGFGSIIVANPQEITRVIVEATLLSNVRAIVSQGWSARLQDKSEGRTTTDTSLNLNAQDTGDSLLHKYPDTIMSLKSVPHDWLFPQIRAVVHHGGAGTTAAGLRAGVPTIVKPFFADQFFWGERVEEMGIGLCIKQLTVESLSAALRVVSTDDRMLKNAKLVGEKIRRENGVETAIQCIYRDMDLAKERTLSSAQASSSQSQEELTTSTLDEDQEWTLVDSTSGPIPPDTWQPATS
ncbi:UDP-Glycosyltransferase/glycogen phosphorylase [Phycomyces blakesleeanus]